MGVEHHGCGCKKREVWMPSEEDRGRRERKEEVGLEEKGREKKASCLEKRY